jgi:parallel beta-helix repeat protein
MPVTSRAVMRFGLLLAVVGLGVFLACAPGEGVRLGQCDGRVLVVPRDFQRISWAVGNASEGDTIRIESGSYSESQVLVDKTVTLIGESPENTLIDGGQTPQCIFQVVANNVVIENLTLQNTNSSAYPPTPAVRLSNAANVSLADVFFNSVGCGVEIMSSNFTRISDSGFSNATCGILVHDSSYAVVAGNTLDSDLTGISITSPVSSHNRVFHNNFVDDQNPLIDFGSYESLDDGYPSGGNFWSGYGGSDLFCGQYQNESGSDGILDKGYIVGPLGVLDGYPFSHPLTEVEVTQGGSSFVLQVSTNSTLTGCFLNDTVKSVNLMIQPYPSTEGSCRIAIPKELLSTNDTGEWRVLEVHLNGTSLERPCSVVTDSENTYLYFSYVQSDVYRIEVVGTMLLSEVSVSFVALLFTLGLVVLVFGRRLMRRGKGKLFSSGAGALFR